MEIGLRRKKPLSFILQAADGDQHQQHDAEPDEEPLVACIVLLLQEHRELGGNGLEYGTRSGA